MGNILVALLEVLLFLKEETSSVNICSALSLSLCLAGTTILLNENFSTLRLSFLTKNFDQKSKYRPKMEIPYAIFLKFSVNTFFTDIF